jgi:hypothetical protein
MAIGHPRGEAGPLNPETAMDLVEGRHMMLEDMRKYIYSNLFEPT